MNKKIFLPAVFLFVLMILPSITKAGYYDYTDTLLIVNDNATSSVAIGDYFLLARPTFPAGNVVHINTVTTETVSRTEYNNNIKTAIETFITTNGLSSTTNYIILTKGVPIVITDTYNSVDSELSACLGEVVCSTFAMNIPGGINNPFYTSENMFSHSQTGIYIVTRLDGYTPNGDISQIEALIDNSSIANVTPEATLKSRSVFVLDGGGSYDGEINPLLEAANTLLAAKGWTTILDETSTYLTGKTNVLGYYSWGSNANGDATKPWNSVPGNTYEKGAIGETAVSTSARSFGYPPSYGQSLITDWIAEGISGMKGYVSEPYTVAVAQPNILFDHYTDGHNLGESYYAASRIIKWKDIVVGDPKTVIVYNPAKIVGFSFNNPSTTGTINESAKTISLTAPCGTNISSLNPSITPSLWSVVTPSGVQDFTNPVTYTVTAMDGITSSAYIVTVNVASSSIVNVTSSAYTVGALTNRNGNRTGTITNIPFGTSKETFKIAILKGQAGQIWNDTGIADTVLSGNTLIITAQDGTTTATYTVAVNDPSTLATVTSSTYTISSLSNGVGTIINIPFGTSKETFKTAILKGQAGQTWNDSKITDTIVTGNILVVIAEDSTTTATYTITVNPAPNTGGGGGGSSGGGGGSSSSRGGGSVSASSTVIINPNLPEAQQIVLLQEQVLKLQTLLKQLLVQKGLSQTLVVPLTKDLKYGSYDDEVILLQNILKKLDFFPTSIKSIKTFGLTTHKAVEDFQIKYDILTSGSSLCGTVGPRTRDKLNELNR